MNLKFAAVMPHPPIIVPEVGNEKDRNKVSATIGAMEKIAKDFKTKEVDKVIVITPHGQNKKTLFTVYKSERFTSSLPGKIINFEGDPELAEKIGNLEGVKISESGNLDHGSSVPLSFLQSESSGFKVAPLTFNTNDRNLNFQLGKKILKTIRNQNENIAIIASADLSHKLNSKAPAGYSEKGEKFDKKIIKLTKENRTEEIIKMDRSLIREAGQCGYGSIIILLGALSQIEYNPEVLSYEGPFGVGYGVLKYNIENNEN